MKNAEMTKNQVDIYERLTSHFLTQFREIQRWYNSTSMGRWSGCAERFGSPLCSAVNEQTSNEHLSLLSTLTDTLKDFDEDIRVVCGEVPEAYVKYREYFCNWFEKLNERENASKEYFSASSDLIFSRLNVMRWVLRGALV